MMFGNNKESLLPVQLEKHIQTSYANPFWYGFNSQTRAFRDVINLLKATFASAAVEKNVFLKGLAGAREAVKAVVTSSKRQSEVSHELLKRGASVELLKAMWNVPESGLGAFATKASNPTIKVSQKIHLAVPYKDAQTCGFDEVEVLVLSPRKLPFGVTSEFAINWTGLKCKSPNDPNVHDGKHLIIHFHGGGFVASTPYSHEPYLRNWVNACGALMLSVNYTKAPQKKYPFALHECFAVYKAAMEYFEPTKVVVCGDSAGGNLCLSVALMAASTGIRTPDGILASYPAGSHFVAEVLRPINVNVSTAADLTKAATVSRLVFARTSTCLFSFLTPI
jgi:acetyl esterase/lipase